MQDIDDSQQVIEAVNKIMNYQSMIVPVDLRFIIDLFSALGEQNNKEVSDLVIKVLKTVPILTKSDLDLLFKSHWILKEKKLENEEENYIDEPIFICGACSTEVKAATLFCPSCGYMNLGVVSQTSQSQEEKEGEDNNEKQEELKNV